MGILNIPIPCIGMSKLAKRVDVFFGDQDGIGSQKFESYLLDNFSNY